MRKLLKYLLHRPIWQRLPLLPRQYSVDFEAVEADRDDQLLMGMSHVRSPQGTRLLQKRHGQTARQLIATLPRRRRRRDVAGRALALVQRALGLVAYDPMKRIAREHQRRPR